MQSSLRSHLCFHFNNTLLKSVDPSYCQDDGNVSVKHFVQCALTGVEVCGVLAVLKSHKGFLLEIN